MDINSADQHFNELQNNYKQRAAEITSADQPLTEIRDNDNQHIIGISNTEVASIFNSSKINQLLQTNLLDENLFF